MRISKHGVLYVNNGIRKGKRNPFLKNLSEPPISIPSKPALFLPARAMANAPFASSIAGSAPKLRNPLSFLAIALVFVFLENGRTAASAEEVIIGAAGGVVNAGADASPRCSDGHPECPEWADMLECEANSKFMHVECRKSCLICGGGDADM